MNNFCSKSVSLFLSCPLKFKIFLRSKVDVTIKPFGALFWRVFVRVVAKHVDC